MIRKSPLVRITCFANDKQEKVQQTPPTAKSFFQEGNSSLVEKAIEGYGVLGRSSVKSTRRRSQPIDIDKFIHDKSREKEIPRNLKVRILVDSQIKAYMQYCSMNQKLADPQKFLELLQSIKDVKITETEFFTSPKSRIQHGRKFNVDVTKNLKMIYEVHDYRTDDNQINWIMRLYDDDKEKKSRSYLNISGSFNRNVYEKGITHIPCGENGRRFVMDIPTQKK